MATKFRKFVLYCFGLLILFCAFFYFAIMPLDLYYKESIFIGLVVGGILIPASVIYPKKVPILGELMTKGWC